MPTPGWQSAILAIARAASVMPVWWIAAAGTDVEIAGEAPEEAMKQTVLAAARAAAQEAGLSLTESIQVPKPPLLVADVEREVNTFATCGPLSVLGGDGRVIPEGAPLTISGRIAKADEQGLLGDAVKPLVGDRPVRFELTTLSVPVCRLLGTLPAASDPALGFAYSYGDKQGTVPGDSYRANENPVIDLAMPADRGGFLTVYYADFDGQVFHLIPHNNRQLHDVSQIGTVENGIRRVRLTWPEAEASLEQLGFRVSEPYGTSLIVAVLSERPLFPGLRPRAESIDAFIDDYTAALNRAGADFAWRFLVTTP
jgi:eukaryotic-like serine/threonine-protein kinase